MKINIGFGALLTLIFITLKLTDHIDWSWFWVLFPVCLPLYFVVAIAAFVIICSIVEAL